MKVTDKPITKMINNQLDIKTKTIYSRRTRRSTQKIKNRKAAGLDEIPAEL